MKKSLFLFLISLFSLPLWSMDAAMYQWKSHFAYGQVDQVIDAGDKVYGLASGSLFSVDKASEKIETYSKQNGLNGGDIACLGFDPQTGYVLIAYVDGLIDFLKQGTFTAMIDLQQKTLSASKRTNKIVVEKSIAYFCMPFGVMAVDVKNHQIKDTYYIGEEGADVNIKDIAFGLDSVYAISDDELLSAANSVNWMDYHNWQRTSAISSDTAFMAIATWNNQLYLLNDSVLLVRKSDGWHNDYSQWRFFKLCPSNNQLYMLGNYNAIFYLSGDESIQKVASSYYPLDISAKGTTYWLATGGNGIVCQTPTDAQSFSVNGPAVNIPYRLKIANNKLYMLAGHRWADENPRRDANIMIYSIDEDRWNNIFPYEVDRKFGYHIFDLMNVAVDPLDAEHFYITSYGTGIIECHGLEPVRHFTFDNSPLESAAPASSHAGDYVRTDGAVFDASGNMWFLNAGVDNLVHVATPAQLSQATQLGVGEWYKMAPKFTTTSIKVPTPGELLIDNRNSNWKWIPSLRYTGGLILLDDNGTPQYKGDDVAVYRNTFVDQDGKTVNTSVIYAVAQDKDGTLWVALETGLITIPGEVDFKTSNRCERIKIARDDGTGLADYLLETECIKAIAVDGANRKWFGTVSSGLYLISEDGETTVAHYTEDNSPLISNEISSLAIDPKTGRVFIGTGKGLMSYQSDSAMPFDDYSSVYVYPNPVRPEYSGVITITGLKDESIVHIADQAGNLVCQTRSLGGTAIWNGCTADGRRAASGVYTVYLNESEDGSHAVTKILLMH